MERLLDLSLSRFEAYRGGLPSLEIMLATKLSSVEHITAMLLLQAVARELLPRSFNKIDLVLVLCAPIIFPGQPSGKIT